MNKIVFEGCWMFVNGKRFIRKELENEETFWEMINLWKNGFSVSRICKIYKMDPSTFISIRKALGFVPEHGGLHLRGNKLKEKLENQNKVIEELKKGKTIKQIVEKTNFSISFVSYVTTAYNKNKEIFKAEKINV